LHYIDPFYVFNDINEFGIPITKTYKYMIGFIDDFSRYIVHWAYIEDKTAKSAAIELQIAL
jgi:hypothetical protein